MKVILTIILLPLLYLSAVRFVTQFIVSTDNSSLFSTTLSNVLSKPQVLDLSGSERPGVQRLTDVKSNRVAVRNPESAIRNPKLSTLLILDPINADYCYLAARELIEKDMNSAERLAGQAIKYSMVDPKNWLLQGWIEGKEGSMEKATMAFGRAVMLDPKRADSLAQQGMFLFQVWANADAQKKRLYHNLALLSMSAAVESDKSLYRNADLNTALASLYYAEGSLSNALGTLTLIPDDDFVGWPLTIKRLALLFDLKNGAKALAIWRAQFNSRKLSAEELTMLESEIREYDLPDFAYFLAKIHVAQGKYDVARKELIDLVSRKGETAEYKVALASVHEHMANNGEASRLYEEALRLSPANQEAKKKVMEYYSKKREVGK